MAIPSGTRHLPTPPAYPDSPAPVSSHDQARARQSDDKLGLCFFRRTPVPTILLDSSLVICQVSDSYLEVLGGCRADQILGLRHNEFFDQRLTVPTRDLANKAIQAAKESRLSYQFDHAQSGGTVWNVRTVPVYDDGSLLYVQIELQDVTGERLKQLELEERVHMNETFRVLVETVKDYAIFMLDPQGNVATWNAGTEASKGYTREEITGKHFSNFFSQKDCQDGKPDRELADALRDGRFAKVTRDLSERHKAEEKMIASYEEASNLKSEFLANMSHEIRTPMHDSEQLELVRMAEESGGILLQVIKDILDYSKLESGCFSVSHDIISVTKIVQSVFKAYQKGCEPGISLDIHLDPKLPEAADGDSLRYRQIVQNLMSNATKFTEQGYFHVNATLVTEEDESYTILTEVVDTGVGISSASSSTLFAPFTQFDNSVTKTYKGTGLGLSICKSLTELMGGNISFRPNPKGCGSIFGFTAKLRKVKQLNHVDILHEQIEALTIQKTDSPSGDIKLIAANKRVLLAEDNSINQRVMVKMLKGLGFANIDLAANGRSAVTMMAKDSLAYHIILMDIDMPVLDGIGATKEIRDAGIGTPIVAMTANALKGQAETYFAKGMSAYIPKPVDRTLLIEVLLSCLRQDTHS
ncbi:hypothetical protein N0V91_011169 [Didymella pomorum]|uniref:Uncharacterized protein n=1 Tax=Didymella pomorum TaxID=749634 RepID=A0A9W8Z014_9PLEO|nr:hypothetical protein N0V91_011169 [Didymella pomorum]